MRQIFPLPPGANGGIDDDADLAAAYPYPPDRPWVRANMVASADGAATLNNRSGGLSSEADHRLFGLLRTLADVVMVGAQTVRAEGYGPARIKKERAHLRAGRPPSPPIAVVTRRMELDLSSRLFTQAPPHARPIIITTAAAPRRRRDEAAPYADVLVAGDELVDLKVAVSSLARRGLQRILTEGGPHLLGQLLTASLLDELCLTVSPMLVGGDASRITTYASLAKPGSLRLAHVLEDEGSLFCRYVRASW